MNKYSRKAKILKNGCDMLLLKTIVKEIEKYFLFTCKNTSNWEIDAESDKEYVYIEVSCQGEKKDERV